MIHPSTTYEVRFVSKSSYMESVNFLDQAKYIFGRKLNQCGTEDGWVISLAPYHSQDEAVDASNELVHLANKMKIVLRDV